VPTDSARSVDAPTSPNMSSSTTSIIADLGHQTADHLTAPAAFDAAETVESQEPKDPVDLQQVVSVLLVVHQLACIDGHVEVCATACISIRGLDPAVTDKLHARAASHGWSIGNLARIILVDAVSGRQDRPNLFDVLMARIGELGGVNIDAPKRAPLSPRAGFE
jgi:plasmid stability protein